MKPRGTRTHVRAYANDLRMIAHVGCTTKMKIRKCLSPIYLFSIEKYRFK